MRCTMLDKKTIGKNIRKRRKELGLTQEKAAEMIDISASFYSHIENGSKSASVKTMRKIAHCLEVSLDSLVLDNQEERKLEDPTLEKIVYRLNKMNEKQKKFVLEMLKVIDNIE